MPLGTLPQVPGAALGLIRPQSGQQPVGLTAITGRRELHYGGPDERMAED